MVRREKCKVCKGRGVVYVRSLRDAVSGASVTVSRTCKKCKGRGWNYVP